MPTFQLKCALCVLTLACVALLMGCNPQSPLLADLFVPLPPSAPVQNSPRHPPPLKQAPIVIEMAEVIKPPDIDWTALYAAMPRDSKGAVDWMRALSENQITLKPGIGPDAQPANTTDSEILFASIESPSKTALFRHTTHTQWLSCKNCHPAVFKKKDENLQFTHDDMKEGKYCGACHFKVVTVPSGCKGCHAGKKPPPAAPAAAAS